MYVDLKLIFNTFFTVILPNFRRSGLFCLSSFLVETDTAEKRRDSKKNKDNIKFIELNQKYHQQGLELLHISLSTLLNRLLM